MWIKKMLDRYVRNINGKGEKRKSEENIHRSKEEERKRECRGDVI